MTPSFCNQNSVKNIVPVTVFLGLLLFFAFYAAAGQSSPPGSEAREDVIHVTSDRLYSDSNARYADFIGNVRATQGTTVITADRLKVYYKSDMKSMESQGPGEESIQKLESTGNVIIEFDNRVAKAEKAIYITDSRILILTGPDASLTSGKNIITGEKITLYREDGRIQVESGKTGRVEALFYQKGKGLN